MTDPELDMMRDFLSEDPTDDIFLDVGRELVARGIWEEAERVLSAGMAVHSDLDEGWSLLGRAALEAGSYQRALEALAHVDTDPASNRDFARMHIVALEQAGRFKDAEKKARAILAIDPDDEAANDAINRMEAPPPLVSTRGVDPFDSVGRAEQYASMGRVDRAIRTYRRILYHNPADAGVAQRLRQLQAQTGGPSLGPPDLSDELTDPDLIPPDLTMPAPALRHVEVADEEDTDPLLDNSEIRKFMAKEGGIDPQFLPVGDASDHDEAPTEHMLKRKVQKVDSKEMEEIAKKAQKKRRRGLLDR